MKFYMDKINISVETWKEILNNKDITDEKTLKILLFLLNSDKCEASGGEIAKKLNYSHHAPINIIIPNFSKKIINNYKNIILSKRKDGKIRYWHVPFLGTEKKDKFTWILRNELKEALIQIYGTENVNMKFPEEYIDELLIFYEGKQKQSLIKTYERNPKAREACLKHYGYKCYICGFDFEKIYGEIGKGIIHVHHKKYSNAENEYKIDPIKDLIPVCPNCHTIIHSKKEMFSIEEMIELMKNGYCA